MPTNYGKLATNFEFYDAEKVLKYYKNHKKGKETTHIKSSMLDEWRYVDGETLKEDIGISRKDLYDMTCVHPEILAYVNFTLTFTLPLFDGEVASVIEDEFSSDLDDVVKSLQLTLKKLRCLNILNKSTNSTSFSEVLDDPVLGHEWSTHLEIWNSEEGDWHDYWGYLVNFSAGFNTDETLEKIEMEIDRVLAPLMKYIGKEEETSETGTSLSCDEEEEQEIKSSRSPTQGKRASKEEWIEYLAKIKAIPIWDERRCPFPVIFRRSKKQEGTGDHITGFGKKTRQRVAEIIGIKDERDCERVREEIKTKLRSLE